MGIEPTIVGFADQRLPTWRPGDLVEVWGLEPQSCNRPFVGFGAGDANPLPRARMTGLEPVTTCFGNKHSVHLSYTLIGSLDGSCTRFFLAENQNDFSIRPQGCTGMMGFEPTIFRSTGDCFDH